MAHFAIDCLLYSNTIPNKWVIDDDLNVHQIDFVKRSIKGTIVRNLINAKYRMKIYKILTLLIFCLFHRGIQAQSTFHISAGATVTTNGNSVITLNNTKFSNNGTFAGTSGTVLIMGNGSNANTTIAGTGTTTFNNLTINKTANNAQLNQNIAVTGNITLTSGGVSLSTGNIDFGSTGILLNETETNRIFGTGGYLQATAALNAPTNSNPANLGAIITSTANLGSTVIKRAHAPFVLNGNGINRSFDIVPANNTGLNATLKFVYLDAELNGNVEANLALWKSTNAGTNFTALPSTNDATNNFIQSTGIPSFALFSGGASPTVTAPTNVSASLTTICRGQSTSLSATCALGAVTWYSASSGGTSIGTGSPLLQSPNANVTYYAACNDGTNESSRVSTGQVTVNPLTTATVTLSPTTICAGTSGSITPTVTNGGSSYSYVWRINQVTQTTASPTINYSTATENDVYSLTVTPSPDACPLLASVTASVRITPLTVPKVYISPAIVCENTDRILGLLPSINLGTTPSYAWKRNTAPLATTSTISVTNAVLGDSYAVTVALSTDAGCYTTYTATSSLIVGCILSVTSGNWEDLSTWNLPRIPAITDNAVINNNHNVTINTDGANANKVEVRVNSKLIYNNSAAKLKLGF